MSRFVERDSVLLVFRDDFGALFQTADDAVHRIQEVLMRDELSVFSCGEQGRFVAHIGDVGAAESWRLLRQEVDVDRVVGFEGTQVHIEDGFALIDVRHVDVDLAVKTTGTHQGLVQNVGAVGRREDDHPTVGPKPVHLGQELIQGVFTLIVGSEVGILAACPANGVDFVNEDDGRRLLFGLLEEVTNARRANPHEHLDKIRAAQAEERHLGFTGNRLGEQGLSGARRAHEKGTLGDFRPEFGVLVGVLEEVHDFLEFFLRAIHARHVVEGHVGALSLFEDLGFGFADVEDLASAWCTTSEATHQEHPHHDHEAKENDPRQDLATPFVWRIVAQVKSVRLLQFLQVGLVSLSVRDVHRRIRAGVKGLQKLRIGLFPKQAVPHFLGEEQVGRVAVVGHPGDLTGFGHFFELGPLHLLLPAGFSQHDRGQQEHGHNGIHPVEVHLTAWFAAGLS